MNTENEDFLSQIQGLVPGQVLQHSSGFAKLHLSAPNSAAYKIRVQLTNPLYLKSGSFQAPEAPEKQDFIYADLSGSSSDQATKNTLFSFNVPCGGPHKVQISKGDEFVDLAEFFVGDLWIMAGQSNMEGIGLMADALPPHPFVRNFSMAREWKIAEDPLHFLSESPDAVHYSGPALSKEEIRRQKKHYVKGAGIGLPFALDMFKRTGLPQGLISCAHGGTTMTQWDPQLANRGGDSLYGSMLLSLNACGSKVAGVLWYQGESDANSKDAPLYLSRMDALIKAFRRDCGNEDLPFIVVQIAREIGRRWQSETWHQIQEYQRQLPNLYKNVELCVSSDLEQDDWIHISGQSMKQLGPRLGDAACRLLYEAQKTPNPQIEKAYWAPDAISPVIVVQCKHIVGSLRSVGRPQAFTLCDENYNEFPLVYQVRYKDDQIILRLTGDELAGIGVCLGLDTEASTNTYDSRGLPLPMFGPIPIQNLPPYSRWLRYWFLSAPLAEEAFFKDDWTSWPLETEGRSFIGWNVINLKEDWQDQAQVRLAESYVDIPEAMTVRVHAGGDGALRLRVNDLERISSHESSPDLGHQSKSEAFELPKGRSKVSLLFNNRGGEAWGFYVRFERVDKEAPLPKPVKKEDL